MSDPVNQLLDRAGRLSCFRAPDRVVLLGGGKTNHNVLVEDGGQAFVVRFGTEIPEHGVLRWNELAITRAADRAGVGPAVRHAEPGVLVLDFVPARPIAPMDRADPAMVANLAALVRRVHRDVFRELEGPVLCFWVFHIIRDYARQLRARGSQYVPLIAALLAEAERLEAAVGPTQIVLAHNDLLPGNILMGDGRLWLIDWEYAGLGNPLFDLGGLASNNCFDAAEERLLLEAYFDSPQISAVWRQYQAMKCVSLLRETLWSMVSEWTSTIDFDYGAYTAENLTAYRAAYQDFQSL